MSKNKDTDVHRTVSNNGLAQGYSLMVRVLSKPGEDILASLTPEKVALWHMGTGVAGEAGELIDAIKKHVIYERAIDRANVIEELGDLEYYMEGVRQQLKITREETLQGNIDKLAVRYPGFLFDDIAAHVRADKQ